MGEESGRDPNVPLNDPFSRHIGISFETVSDGKSVAKMEVTEDHLNANGTLHGGAIFSLADATAGAALNSLWAEQTGVALEANVSFLSAAERTDTVIGRAEVTEEGRKTAEITVTVELADGTKVASSRSRGYKL
ncbi:hotdog fold thioesterase [Halobellus sp. GM3]|uniref:hotdog fold thioesterase n=1 Tax=Halobellus sp. GM3 TaxID=3458410 RepID=UPI00403D846E